MISFNILIKVTFLISYISSVKGVPNHKKWSFQQSQFNDDIDGCVTSIADFFYNVLLRSEMPGDKTIEKMDANNHCGFCQYAMKSLYQIVGDKDNEEKIRHSMETIYWMMPKSLDDKCDEFFKNGTEKIVDMILLEFTPNQVCWVWGVCTSQSQTFDIFIRKEKQDYTSQDHLEKKISDSNMIKYLNANDCETNYSSWILVLACLSGFILSMTVMVLYNRLKKTDRNELTKVTTPILKPGLNKSYYEKMSTLSENDEELNI